MALPTKPYGKDRVVRGSEGFISQALTGGSGKSAGMYSRSAGRPHQEIITAFPADNVKLAMPIKSSLIDDDPDGFSGGVDNLKHSLTGSSAVNEEVGAAGPVKHVIIPNH